MSIRLKLTLPIILLWAILYGIFYFYWLPTLSAENISRYQTAQKKDLSLLALTLLEAISRDDLAQVYITLNNVMAAHNEWRQLTLLDNEQNILYPLVLPTLQNPQPLQMITWTQNQAGKPFVTFQLLANPNALMQKQDNIVTELQWIFCILFVVTLVASVTLEDKIVRHPIKALDKAINCLGRGDFSTDLPLASHDEIGQLVKGFATMRNRIENYQNELQLTRDQALEAMLTRDEAIEATQAKSEFMAKMSHELRTPLNAIIGYSELLYDVASDNGDESYKKDINKIKYAGSHLLTIINDILDLSKIESGHFELHYQKINLETFILETVAIFQPEVTATGTELNINVALKNRQVDTDPIKLRQILINLLSNANKFTTQGKISLSIRSVTQQGCEYFSIAVKDTGQGIEQYQLNNIFEPFNQADNSYSRQYEGVGIGLTLCKQLCSLMDGTIEVKSKIGKGTTFTLNLPVTPNTDTEINLPPSAT